MGTIPYESRNGSRGDSGWNIRQKSHLLSCQPDKKEAKKRTRLRSFGTSDGQAARLSGVAKKRSRMARGSPPILC